ncbi:hypothetical protein [Anaeromyxobacter sp. SG26]|uniref:hypothetical protein n=1 Tax=Anaeromyxobacter sp. SG26 TaxID=2925407 RepID=UPI001F5AC175|nr:hypothetical protein [Anaeromyxobacter sp. SG26]
MYVDLIWMREEMGASLQTRKTASGRPASGWGAPKVTPMVPLLDVRGEAKSAAYAGTAARLHPTAGLRLLTGAAPRRRSMRMRQLRSTGGTALAHQEVVRPPRRAPATNRTPVQLTGPAFSFWDARRRSRRRSRDPATDSRVLAVCGTGALLVAAIGLNLVLAGIGVEDRRRSGRCCPHW